jgi:hypothetical protein
MENSLSDSFKDWSARRSLLIFITRHVLHDQTSLHYIHSLFTLLLLFLIYFWLSKEGAPSAMPTPPLNVLAAAYLTLSSLSANNTLFTEALLGLVLAGCAGASSWIACWKAASFWWRDSFGPVLWENTIVISSSAP